MQVVRNRGVRHAEIVVRDIMTPADRLDVIDLNDVLHAEVGHVVATLKQSGRQHALVVDADEAGRQMIRGIFSATQIARQLGIVLHTPEIARTFAEIGAAIGL
jgi:CBS domain containing-hemolysin-like protein